MFPSNGPTHATDSNNRVRNSLRRIGCCESGNGIGPHARPRRLERLEPLGHDERKVQLGIADSARLNMCANRRKHYQYGTSYLPQFDLYRLFVALLRDFQKTPPAQ